MPQCTRVNYASHKSASVGSLSRLMQMEKLLLFIVCEWWKVAKFEKVSRFSISPSCIENRLVSRRVPKTKAKRKQRVQNEREIYANLNVFSVREIKRFLILVFISKTVECHSATLESSFDSRAHYALEFNWNRSRLTSGNWALFSTISFHCDNFFQMTDSSLSHFLNDVLFVCRQIHSKWFWPPTKCSHTQSSITSTSTGCRTLKQAVRMLFICRLLER